MDFINRYFIYDLLSKSYFAENHFFIMI